MELVTLAHVTFSRIGSAGRPGFVPHKEVTRIKEVPDSHPETLLEFVKTVAEEEGELGGSLTTMRQENAWNYGTPQGHIVFNIQGLNVQYSSPYAICYAHPALKIGDRYFKLDEVR